MKDNLIKYGTVEFQTSGSLETLKKRYGQGDNVVEVPGGFYSSANKLVFTSLATSRQDSFSTLIHEADHRLNDILKSQFPEIWDQIVAFTSKQKEFEIWVTQHVVDPKGAYSNLSGDRRRQVDEFLAQVTGPQGAQILYELQETNPGFIEKLMSIFTDLIKAISAKIRNVDSIETLDDLIQANLGILIKGNKIESAFNFKQEYNQRTRNFVEPEDNVLVKIKPEFNKDYEEFVKTLEELANGPAPTSTINKLVKAIHPDWIQSEISASFRTTGKAENLRDSMIEQSQRVREASINNDFDGDKTKARELVKKMKKIVLATNRAPIGYRGKPLAKGKGNIMWGMTISGSVFDPQLFLVLNQFENELLAGGLTHVDLVKIARWAVAGRSPGAGEFMTHFFNWLESLPNWRALLQASYSDSEIRTLRALTDGSNTINTSMAVDRSELDNIYKWNGLHTSADVSVAINHFAPKKNDPVIITMKPTRNEIVFVGFKNEYEVALRNKVNGKLQVYEVNEYLDTEGVIENEEKKKEQCMLKQ